MRVTKYKRCDWSTQISEIKNRTFNTQKISKLDKIAKKNKKLKLFMRKVSSFGAERKMICENLEDDVNEHLELITNFHGWSAMKKRKLINKKIYDAKQRYTDIKQKLNLIHKSEDYIRFLLSNLKELFSKIQAEILKIYDSIGLKQQKKVTNGLDKTLLLFKTANSQLDGGNYENLKNIYIEICTKLKFWCRICPYIVVGVITVTSIFKQMTKKMNKLILYGLTATTDRAINDKLKKIKKYSDMINVAIDSHNFFEIAKGVDDVAGLVNDVIALFKWDKFVFDEFNKTIPKVVHYFQICENYYLQLCKKIKGVIKKCCTQQVLEDFIIQLKNAYQILVKEYDQLTAPYREKQSQRFVLGSLENRKLFHGNYWDKSVLIIKTLKNFTNLINLIGTKVNKCLYYQFFIRQECDNIHQYIICVVNNLIRFDIKNHQEKILKIKRYSGFIIQISYLDHEYTLSQLYEIYIQVQDISQKVLKLYHKVQNSKKQIKSVGRKLALLNYQANQNYFDKKTKSVISEAIRLYANERYDEAVNSLKLIEDD